MHKLLRTSKSLRVLSKFPMRKGDIVAPCFIPFRPCVVHKETTIDVVSLYCCAVISEYWGVTCGRMSSVDLLAFIGLSIVG